MKDAFTEPLPLSDMIRITFITGAGKLGRQRYDEGAPKAVTSTLRELGFEEDRGASCVVECGGSFKSQHDTGKNPKTIVVFPKISGADGGLNGGMAGLSVGDAAQDESPSLLPRERRSTWSRRRVWACSNATGSPSARRGRRSGDAC